MARPSQNGRRHRTRYRMVWAFLIVRVVFAGAGSLVYHVSFLLGGSVMQKRPRFPVHLAQDGAVVAVRAPISSLPLSSGALLYWRCPPDHVG